MTCSDQAHTCAQLSWHMSWLVLLLLLMACALSLSDQCMCACTGNLEANIDSLSLAMDFHGRSIHSNQLDMHTLHHVELSHLAEPIPHASNLGWQNQIAAYLGANAGSGPMLI